MSAPRRDVYNGPGSDWQSSDLVIPEDVISVYNVTLGTYLNESDIRLLFDSFYSGYTLAAGHLIRINFRKPIWIKEAKIVDPTAAKTYFSNDIKRRYETVDADVVTFSGCPDERADLVDSACYRVSLENASGVSKDVCVFIRKSLERRVFPQEYSNWADSGLVSASDLNIEASNFGPSASHTVYHRWDEIFQRGNRNSIWLDPGADINLYFNRPIWADEMELFQYQGANAALGNALPLNQVSHRVTLPTGETLDFTGTDNKSIVKSKITGVRFRNVSGAGLYVTHIAIRKSHSREVFPEAGSNWRDEEVVASDEVHVGTPSVWNTVALSYLNARALFDDGMFGAGLSLPAAASAVLYFRKPIWLDEFEVFSSATAQLNSVVTRSWVLEDGTVVPEGADTTISVVKSKVVAVGLLNPGVAPVTVTHVSLKKYHHRMTFAEDGALFATEMADVIESDDIDEDESSWGGASQSKEEWNKPLHFKGPGKELNNGDTVEIWLNRPMWIDEMEVLDKTTRVAYTGADISRGYVLPDGSTVTDATAARKTLVKTKVVGLVFTSALLAPANVVLSVKKYHHRMVFPEESAVFRVDPYEFAVPDDVHNVLQGVATWLTKRQIENLLMGSIHRASETFTLAAVDQMTVFFKHPVWADELEVLDSPNGNAIVATTVERRYMPVEGGVVADTTGYKTIIKRKIRAVQIVNVSGAPVTFNIISVKKYHHRMVFPEDGAVFTTEPNLVEATGTVSVAGAGPQSGEIGLSIATNKGKIKRIVVVRTSVGGTAYTADSLRVNVSDKAVTTPTDGLNSLYYEDSLEPAAVTGKVINKTDYNFGEIMFNSRTTPTPDGKVYVSVYRTGGAVDSAETYTVIVQGERCT